MTEHTFSAWAFEENFSLKELARGIEGSRLSPHELSVEVGSGWVFYFPFGAVVFCDVEPETRDREVARVRALMKAATPQVVTEEFTVREDAGGARGVHDGALTIDRMTPGRAGVCALTVGQSAAMEYYERIVDSLQARTHVLVERLETRGTVAARTRRLHRFIGEAISVRTEVLNVLHLLDKPDATWDDPAMDEIYRELREEFDLVDRYEALESKLRSVQEALELVLGVARDARMVFLEAAIVVLILFEIVMSFVRG